MRVNIHLNDDAIYSRDKDYSTSELWSHLPWMRSNLRLNFAHCLHWYFNQDILLNYKVVTLKIRLKFTTEFFIMAYAENRVENTSDLDLSLRRAPEWDPEFFDIIYAKKFLFSYNWVSRIVTLDIRWSYIWDRRKITQLRSRHDVRSRLAEI